jgi:putative membrane protein
MRRSDVPIDPRVWQANERTLLSWVRTGLSLIAFGFVVERVAVWFALERDVEPETTMLVFGAGIVGLGALCQIVGAVRFITVKRALGAGREPSFKTTGPVLLALMTALLGLGLFTYVFVQATT